MPKEEKAVNPPLGLPVRDIISPVASESFFSELIDTSSSQYRPIERGTIYSSIVGADQRIVDSFPSLYFIRETPSRYPYAVRIWATDKTAESSYNADITYAAESLNHPTFTRIYVIRREVYDANPTIAYAAAFTGLIGVKITGAGTGYTTATGTVGTGATVKFIISAGTIISGIVTNEGSAVTHGAAITIAGDGTGATATAIAQPTGAVLVHQEKKELPDTYNNRPGQNDPRAHEYVMVIRVYKTMPGPILTDRSIGQKDLTPEKYRRLITTNTIRQLVGSTYVFPSNLTGNQSQVELQFETIEEARLTITEEIIESSEAALIGGETGEFGPMTITESIVEEGDAIDTGPLVLNSKITPLGNGKAIKITVTYPSNLAALELVDRSLGQENLMPAKYRRLVTTQATRKLVDSTYVFPTSLSGDESSIRLQWETIERARLTIVEEIIETDEAALEGSELGEFGLMQILESVVDDGSPADTGILVRASTVTALGNGKSIKITVRYPANLADLELVDKSIGQEDLTPQKYRRLVTTQATRRIVGTSYIFPSSLSGDETQIQLQWETIERARLRIVEEVIESEDSQLTGGEYDKWGVLTIVETVVSEGTAIDTGFLVKASTVTPFGNGKAVKITISYPANLAEIELKGQELDRRLNLAFPTIQRIAPAGAEIGDTGKDIQPIDTERSLVTEIDLTAVEALIETYVLVYPGTTNIDFPDVLESVIGVIEETSGEGFYDENGSGQIANRGSIGLSLRGTGQASAAILPDVIINIRQIWARNIPTTHYLFFLPMPITASDVTTKLTALIGASVTAWPIFRPVAHTITLMGQRLSLQVQANVQFSASLSVGGGSASADLASSEGEGYSKEVGLTMRTVRIPPTIHGLINLSGQLTGSESLTASADVATGGDIVLHAERSESGSVAASITPSSLAATGGETSIPTSGKRILNVDADPWQYNYARIHCEVVDFTDVPG